MNEQLLKALQLQRMYQQNPVKYISEVLGNKLWSKQQDICNALVNHRDVAVKSGHGIGKSKVVSDIVLWWLSSYFPSKVITTAPTFLQVEKIIWQELRSSYGKAKFNIGGNLTKTELNMGDNWYALGVSTDEVDRFQGFHSPNLLVILDEGSGVNQNIWEASSGLVTTSNNKRLAIGNPLSPLGAFYDCFKENSDWYKMTVSCLEIPNYIIEREQTLGLAECIRQDPGYKGYRERGLSMVPGLTGYQWVEARRKEWGEDNPLWFSKVLGLFPVESENTLIPLTWIENGAIIISKLPSIAWGIGVDVSRWVIRRCNRYF